MRLVRIEGIDRARPVVGELQAITGTAITMSVPDTCPNATREIWKC